MRPLLLIICLFLWLLLAALPAGAAQSDLTVTSGTVTMSVRQRSPMIEVYSIDWTSDASGNVVAATDAHLFGEVSRVATNPDAGGDAPSDNYDIVLEDEDGLDVLAGLGANRDTANSEHFSPKIGDGATSGPLAVGGKLTFKVTNAGNAKGGVFRLYLRRF